MNLKTILMGLLTAILTLFGSCKESKKIAGEAIESFGRNFKEKRKVSWEQVVKGDDKDVQIEFKQGEVELGNMVDLLTKSRLQSKTTTILTAELIVVTNLEFKLKPVYVSFKCTKRIPKHLKTQRDRKPYLDQVINEVKVMYKNIKDPLDFNYVTDSTFDKQYKDAVIIKASKK